MRTPAREVGEPREAAGSLIRNRLPAKAKIQKINTKFWIPDSRYARAPGYRFKLIKRCDPRHRPPQNQRMNVVSTFERIDDFHIHHVTDDVVLVGDAVRTVNVSTEARDVEGLAGRIAFNERDHLRRNSVFIA